MTDFNPSSGGRPCAIAIAASYGKLRALLDPAERIQKRPPAACSFAAEA